MSLPMRRPRPSTLLLRPTGRAACALLGLACLLPAPGYGQGRSFEWIEVSAGLTGDAGRSTYQSYWQRGYGGELSVATPLFAGQAEAGAALHRYATRLERIPRFDAFFAFAGWGVALAPSPHVGWYNGFRLGNYHMRFDEETFTGVRNESELAIALQSRLDLSPVRGWTLFGSVTLQQVYTYIRLRQVYVTAGLRHRMDSPRWLEAFLR
jgi:hypothetical protein